MREVHIVLEVILNIPVRADFLHSRFETLIDHGLGRGDVEEVDFEEGGVLGSVAVDEVLVRVVVAPLIADVDDLLELYVLLEAPHVKKLRPNEARDDSHDYPRRAANLTYQNPLPIVVPIPLARDAADAVVEVGLGEVVRVAVRLVEEIRVAGVGYVPDGVGVGGMGVGLFGRAKSEGLAV